MTPDLNPVQTAIRDHVAERYPAWSRTHDSFRTRAGFRYRGLDVALLFRGVLRDIGLHVYDDGYYYLGVFVTSEGRRVTREALTEQIRPSISGLGDAALVDTVGTAAFFEALADLVPDYDGSVMFTRADAIRPQVAEDTRAAVEDFLREIVDEPAKASEVFGVYAEFADADEVPVLGKTTFYRIAEETGLVRRARRRDGLYLLPLLRRFARRLMESTAEALMRATEVLGSGPRSAEECEAYADEAARVILEVAPDTRPDALDSRVVALPANVAFALAGVPNEEVRRTFVRMAREHLRTHEIDRPALLAVANALRAGDPDGLVSQIRARCASEIEAEADA